MGVNECVHPRFSQVVVVFRNGELHALTPDGRPLLQLNTTLLAHQGGVGMASTPRGALLVVDATRNRVLKFI